MTDVVMVRQLARALGVEHAEPLPTGYTRLEYIESDGGQYIDTELKPDQNMRVRAVFDCVDTKNTIVFGARPTANKSELFFLLHAEDTDSFRDDWGSDKQSVPTSSVPTRGTVTVDKDKNRTVFNGSYTVEHPSSTWSSQYNLYLFAGNNGGVVFNPTSIRLRSFEVWDGDEKVRESVPARRCSGHVGLLDVVNNSFLVSEGDSDFIAGPEVPTSDTSDTDGCAVTVKQFSVASSKLGGGGEQPPAGLKETVIYEGSEGRTLYFQRQLTAIRKVVVEYREYVNLSYLYTFTYEGEPTGSHTSSNGRVQISFGVVGVSPTLIVEDATGASLIRFERVTIYEQQ